MALNIFPRRSAPSAEQVPALEQESTLPEPSPEALDEPKKRTRRGSRGGRGRNGHAADATAEAGDGTPSEAAAEAEPEAEAAPKPAPARRGARARAAAPAETAPAEQAPAAEAQATAPDEAADEKPAARSRRGRGRTAEPVEPAEAPEAPAEKAAPAPARPPRDAALDTQALLRAIEAQGRQIEQIARSQEEILRRNGHAAHTRPPRVGIFVDAANIELGCDRLRARLDWKKVLDMLTEERQLVRAVAYSPVHEDPGVSLETQRFAEPFLGRGYKVVTKSLKRFADGSVKANVDVEMTLDVVSMLDRLDIVCLVSGDGDFQPLVEFVQRSGVRCEVVGVGTSTAGQLRNAADEYIDLGARIKELRQ